MNVDLLSHALAAKLILAIAEDADEATIKAALEAFPRYHRRSLDRGGHERHRRLNQYHNSSRLPGRRAFRRSRWEERAPRGARSMDKPRDDVCGCCGRGVQSPSLRALIDIVEKAEAKKAEAEAHQAASDPVPANEQRQPDRLPL